jgi:hypothetical protein
VTIRVIDDDIDEGIHNITVAHSTPSADVDFDSSISRMGLLSCSPISSVVVDIGTSSGLSASPAQIGFDSSNWNIDVHVEIGLVRDFVSRNAAGGSYHAGSVTHTFRSDDRSYTSEQLECSIVRLEKIDVVVLDTEYGVTISSA